MWSTCAGEYDLFFQAKAFYFRIRLLLLSESAIINVGNVSVFMAVENGDIGMLKSLGIKVELLSQSLNL